MPDVTSTESDWGWDSTPSAYDSDDSGAGSVAYYMPGHHGGPNELSAQEVDEVKANGVGCHFFRNGKLLVEYRNGGALYNRAAYYALREYRAASSYPDASILFYYRPRRRGLGQRVCSWALCALWDDGESSQAARPRRAIDLNRLAGAPVPHEEMYTELYKAQLMADELLSANGGRMPWPTNVNTHNTYKAWVHSSRYVHANLRIGALTISAKRVACGQEAFAADDEASDDDDDELVPDQAPDEEAADEGQCEEAAAEERPPVGKIISSHRRPGAPASSSDTLDCERSARLKRKQHPSA